MSTLLWVLAGVLVLLALFAIKVFNSLIMKRNTVKNSASDIEVQTKRRYDLVPNLVETVKGYAAHEEGVFTKVTEARAKAMSAPMGPEKGAAENQFSSALKSLFAVAENYPQLRANENFLHLQGELSKIEEAIQSARRFYNAAVREFNNAIGVFPNNVVAGMLGFNAETFFDADDKVNEPVAVKF